VWEGGKLGSAAASRGDAHLDDVRRAATRIGRAAVQLYCVAAIDGGVVRAVHEEDGARGALDALHVWKGVAQAVDARGGAAAWARCRPQPRRVTARAAEAGAAAPARGSPRRAAQGPRVWAGLERGGGWGGRARWGACEGAAIGRLDEDA